MNHWSFLIFQTIESHCNYIDCNSCVSYAQNLVSIKGRRYNNGHIYCLVHVAKVHFVHRCNFLECDETNESLYIFVAVCFYYDHKFSLDLLTSDGKCYLDNLLLICKTLIQSRCCQKHFFLNHWFFHRKNNFLLILLNCIKTWRIKENYFNFRKMQN